MTSTSVSFHVGAFIFYRMELIKKVNFYRKDNNHRVLWQVGKKANFSYAYKADYKLENTEYMSCKNFNIYYDSFVHLSAETNLLNTIPNNPTSYYNNDTLELQLTKAFHILKTLNPSNYLMIFKIYIKNISRYTIYELNIDFTNELTDTLDAIEMTIEDVLNLYGVKRNWERVSKYSEDFQKELYLDQKLFNNRLYLKKAVAMFKENKIVTINTIGIKGNLAYWRNITSLVDELVSFTDIPNRKDAIYTIEECFRYFSMLKKKPSVNNVKIQLGGSVPIIKLAMHYYYDKGGKLYTGKAKKVIKKMQHQIDNPLQYNVEQDGTGISLKFNKK